jgi:cysteine desulfurase
MTLNAAKIYGPKGIGLLYKKTGVMLEPLIHGGGQEQGFRSGTQDTAAIVGFAVALRLAEQQREAETKRLAALRDSFIASLKSAVNGLRLNGDPSRRLPNNVNVSIDGVDGEALVVYLDQHGIAASTGAACVAHRSEPSHVLLAMGVSAEQAKESIRFTFGRSTTRDGLEKVVAVLPSLIDKLRVEETLNADR